jgi:hypothetical protein
MAGKLEKKTRESGFSTAKGAAARKNTTRRASSAQVEGASQSEHSWWL